MNGWLGLVVALIGVVLAAIIAYPADWLNKQVQRNQVQNELADLCDEVLAFRAEHPEDLRLSQSCKPDCFRAMYVQESAEDKQWALYTTHAELWLSFHTAVLHGWRMITWTVVPTRDVRPLFKLPLT